MNEEEKKAIDYFENIEFNEYEWWHLTGDGYVDHDENELKKAQLLILKLIEEQQKEIEDLEIKTKVVTAYHCDNLPTDVKMIILSKTDFERNINNDYICKDKIREKIKELEDNMILFTNDKEKFNRYKYARNTLETLLKENNNE